MEGWIDIKNGDQPGRIPWGMRLRVGGAGCDVPVADSQGDELHLWADPPRLVLSGSRTTVLVNGRALEECALEEGDTIQWQGLVVVVHPVAAAPEAPQEASPPAVAPKAPFSQGPTNRSPGGDLGAASTLRQLSLQDLPVSRRILAGIAAEMGLGNKAAVKRWQAAVLRGEWDPDACAAEVLAGVDLESTALQERSGRIQRDLLMTSFQRGVRGVGRKARGAARGGSAFLLANVLALVAYSIVIAILLVLARTRMEWSLDGTIDGFVKSVGELLGVRS